MKKKELNNLRELSITALVEKINTFEKKLKSLRVEKSTKQQKNVRQAKRIRIDIAIAKTLFREKQIIQEGSIPFTLETVTGITPSRPS